MLIAKSQLSICSCEEHAPPFRHWNVNSSLHYQAKLRINSVLLRNWSQIISPLVIANTHKFDSNHTV